MATKTDNKTYSYTIGSGGDGKARIEQLTAEAISKSFLQVTEDMRAVALQAKQEAAKLEAEADQLSQLLIEKGSSFAAQIGALIERCRLASDTFRKHRDGLFELISVPTPALTGSAAETTTGSDTATAITEIEKQISKIDSEQPALTWRESIGLESDSGGEDSSAKPVTKSELYR